VTDSDSAGSGGLPGGEAAAGLEMLSVWQTPVLDVEIRYVPVFLLPRLAEMAAEVPDTSLGRKIYCHRAQCLAVLARVAQRADAAAFRAAEPPSPAEQRVGSALSNAFYQECSLADIMLASGLSAEQVVAIGKRTIRRRKWLRKLAELNPGLAP
jgi:hypothetical protein